MASLPSSFMERLDREGLYDSDAIAEFCNCSTGIIELLEKLANEMEAKIVDWRTNLTSERILLERVVKNPSLSRPYDRMKDKSLHLERLLKETKPAIRDFISCHNDFVKSLDDFRKVQEEDIILKAEEAAVFFEHFEVKTNADCNRILGEICQEAIIRRRIPMPIRIENAILEEEEEEEEGSVGGWNGPEIPRSHP